MAGNIIAFISSQKFLNGDFEFKANSQNQVFVLTIINLQFMNLYSKTTLELKPLNNVPFEICLICVSVIHVSDQKVYLQWSYCRIN